MVAGDKGDACQNGEKYASRILLGGCGLGEFRGKVANFSPAMPTLIDSSKRH